MSVYKRTLVATQPQMRRMRFISLKSEGPTKLALFRPGRLKPLGAAPAV